MVNLERDVAYFKALKNNEFANLDARVRMLTLQFARGEKVERELEIAKAEREALFTKFYTPPPKPEKLPYRLNSKKHEKLFKLLKQYVDKFPYMKIPNIVMLGQTGSGKTYAATAVGDELTNKSFKVVLLTAFTLISRFKKFVFEHDNMCFDELLNCDLLILDDLGAEPTIKNVTEQCIYNIINERLISGKPFIITSNLNADEIKERYKDRITSRILSKQTSMVFDFSGKDLRLEP